jgi:hypothetical protein
MFLIMVMIVVLASDQGLQAGENADRPPQQTMTLQSTRGTRDFAGTMAVAQGHSRYVRYTIHDGNLIVGAIYNTGLLSYHYYQDGNRLSWPKGPKKVAYIHSGVFYVAAEVTDARGNTIHICSDNYRRSSAEMSVDLSHEYATMPLPGYYNQDQPAAQFTPEVYGISEDVGIDGMPNTKDTGEGDGILQAEEDFNNNKVLDLSMQNAVGWFAQSSRRETWPRDWPAGSYYGESGVRAGRWNGEYGAYARADQESYYVMDDAENDEYEYYPFDDMRPWPLGRRGLGITASVRHYQWSSRLSEDIMVGIYDIANNGKDLNKCVVGMYVDPDMGGTLEGDDAWFDTKDDITYCWSKIPISENGYPMGYFGFAFLESPGISDDGVDNDQDGLTDESQTNGLDDDMDWRSWEDVNGNGVWDSEDTNRNGRMDGGEDLNGNARLDYEPLNDDVGSDGVGPDDEDYPGPDPDHTEANGQPDPGEPNFDETDNSESDQVGLTSFFLRDVDNTIANDEKYWQTEITPGSFNIRPGYQRDIAFTYGSGYVKFAGLHKKHRYAIALLFGNDEEDIRRNKRTMQVIYDNDYNFTKPPRKPLLSAMADDRKVYLSWDSAAEDSKDPIYGKDFEAYYVYRATDPSFQDIKTITDGFGNPLLFKPMAIFDLKDGLRGIHPVRLGSEISVDSDLGVAYHMGTDSGLQHQYVDTTVTNGRTYYYAVVSVDKGYTPSFYPSLSDREGLLTISATECSANIMTDPLGRPISADRNCAIVVPTEKPAGWQSPQLASTGIRHTAGAGTGRLEVRVAVPLAVKHNQKYHVTFTDDNSFFELDSAFTGLTRSMIAGLAGEDDGTLGVLQNPETNANAAEFIVDGFLLELYNHVTELDTVYWKKGSSAATIKDMTVELRGIAVPRDYEFRIMKMGAELPINVATPTNFQLWDVTDPKKPFKVAYRFTESKSVTPATRGMLKEGIRVIPVNNTAAKKQLWKWDFVYPAGSDSSKRTIPVEGDVLAVVTHKPFDRHDVFEFTMTGNNVDQKKAANDLNDIYTVPDPYIAVSTLERKIVNQDEGRGDRRIDFVNLPQQCSISIFTASGRLVRRLEHSSAQDKSRESWDLRTKDGLEITHGIYFYAVEAPGLGTKLGKLAVIK